MFPRVTCDIAFGSFFNILYVVYNFVVHCMVCRHFLSDVINSVRHFILCTRSHHRGLTL